MNGPGCHGRRFVYLLVTVVSLWSAAPAAVGVPVPENDGLVPAPGNGQPAEPAPIHPPIALTVGAASAEEQRSCIAFNASGPGSHCSFTGVVPEALMASLLQSDRFASVSLSTRETPHVLTLAATTYMGESLGSVLGAGLSGATLNLLPVKQKKVVRIEADLRWRGLPLRTLDYEFPVVERMHLFQHDDGRAEMHRQLAEALLAEFDAEGLLTPEYLFAALDVSNYKRDLKVPQEIVGLPYRGRRIFPDPFLGVGIAYGRESRDARVNVFVYPIAKADWFDEQALVRQQAAEAVAEMRMVAEHNGSELNLSGDLEILNLDARAHSVPVAVQRGNLVGAQGQQSKTMLCLFRRGDKFVKIRATDVGELPLALLVDTIEVPPESGFMALLRAGARERSARTPTHEADVLYVE